MSSTVAAWSALLAAVTSLATLFAATVIAGRREHRMWTRNALTGALVAYLDASWRSTDALRRSVTFEVTDPARTAQLEAARTAYREMRSQLTRLRLLASSKIVEAGEQLLQVQRATIDTTSIESADFARVSAGRAELVRRARRDMALPK